jgi:hypothetical protein
VVSTLFLKSSRGVTLVWMLMSSTTKATPWDLVLRSSSQMSTRFDVGLPPDDIVREAAAKNGGEDMVVFPDLFEELLQRGFVAFGLWAFGLWAGRSGGSGHPGSPG